MIAQIHNSRRALSSVLAAYTLMAGISAVCFGGNADEKSTAQSTNWFLGARVFTNTNGLEEMRFAFMTALNTQYVYNVSLGVRPEFTVKTNMEGVIMLLSMTTNRFSGIAAPEAIINVVSGTASGTPWLNWAGGYPLFGSCTVSNTETGRVLQNHRPPPEITSVTGGQLTPPNVKEFRISLRTFFNPGDRGTYAVRFKGKLSLSGDPKGEVEFETPPLFFTIDEF
jgi:hypothetical protein